VRERFWRHDHSPERVREREQALVRALERAYTQLPPEQTHERQRNRGRARAWGWGLDDTPQGGMHVHTLEHTP